jgi:hypothetical protein
MPTATCAWNLWRRRWGEFVVVDRLAGSKALTPFSGSLPGFATHCPGEITPNKLEILRNADAVYIEQMPSRPLKQLRGPGLCDDD